MDVVYKMEWMSQTESWVILAKCILTVAVMWLSYQVLEERVLTPMRIKRVLARQGVRGPPPKWLTGNVLEKNQLMKDACATDMKTGDYNHVQRLMPEHVLWTKQYGKIMSSTVQCSQIVHCSHACMRLKARSERIDSSNIGTCV